eukprot:456490-Prymnesium_polylepis.1
MPRVVHNTLGCHPLLHTEAHESTHHCASPRSRAHADLFFESSIFNDKHPARGTRGVIPHR